MKKHMKGKDMYLALEASILKPNYTKNSLGLKILGYSFIISYSKCLTNVL